MNNKIISNHNQAYSDERNYRWNMAEQFEEKAILKFIEILRGIIQDNNVNIQYYRVDKIYFKKYNVCNDDWIKGSPDYLIVINIDKSKYMYIEIKLKAFEFRKTIIGGTTSAGSIITNYGCPSYYLDIEPVYMNMCKFCINEKIVTKYFIIIFVSDQLTEFRIISLNKIDLLIKKGFLDKKNNYVPLCKFGEGYGKTTYLIPKDSTTDIKAINKQQLFFELCSDDIPETIQKAIKRIA